MRLLLRCLHLNNTIHFRIVAVLCDAHGRVYFSLHRLILALSLDQIPVGRLVGLVGDFARPLVWLPILIRVEDISVVDGQASRLLLVQFTVLILIYLYLLLDLSQSTRIHLSSGHETPNFALKLKFLHALRRNVFIFLFDLSLKILRQPTHAFEDFDLLCSIKKK